MYPTVEQADAYKKFFDSLEVRETTTKGVIAHIIARLFFIAVPMVYLAQMYLELNEDFALSAMNFFSVVLLVIFILCLLGVLMEKLIVSVEPEKWMNMQQEKFQRSKKDKGVPLSMVSALTTNGMLYSYCTMLIIFISGSEKMSIAMVIVSYMQAMINVENTNRKISLIGQALINGKFTLKKKKEKEKAQQS